MQRTVYRERKVKGAVYTAENSPIYGESNNTISVFLDKISIYKDGEIVAKIQQRFFILKLICLLLQNIIFLPPYEIKYRSKKPNYIRAAVISLFSVLSGRIGDNRYELRHHNNNICSLMRDDLQIATIKKESLSELERNIYIVSYSDERDFDICFLFCVLLDVHWYKDDSKWEAVRYEKTLVPFDRYPERANWEP